VVSRRTSPSVDLWRRRRRTSRSSASRSPDETRLFDCRSDGAIGEPTDDLPLGVDNRLGRSSTVAVDAAKFVSEEIAKTVVKADDLGRLVNLNEAR
jgi:hypothetical protein